MDNAIEHIENLELSYLPPWMRRGACVGEDPELWYPERGRSAEPAKQMCARCPVREECLDWALENENHGIWGGLSLEGT